MLTLSRSLAYYLSAFLDRTKNNFFSNFDVAYRAESGDQSNAKKRLVKRSREFKLSDGSAMRESFPVPDIDSLCDLISVNLHIFHLSVEYNRSLF